jgi:hypothetical protein
MFPYWMLVVAIKILARPTQNNGASEWKARSLFSKLERVIGTEHAHCYKRQKASTTGGRGSLEGQSATPDEDYPFDLW